MSGPAAPVLAAGAGALDASSDRRAAVLELAALHSLVWLVAANAVGLLLAVLLLAPRLGELLSPASYGRWMPVHLDLELYGWSSLPLVAVLLRLYLPRETGTRAPGLALAAWSGALAFGAVSWLGGKTSGKAFLDWSGAARALFPAAMLLLAVVLAAGAWRSWRTRDPAARAPLLEHAAKAVLLAVLLAVPGLLYWAASPSVHPPINPETSGPTGTSLLGSGLAIIALFAGAPLLAGLRAKGGPRFVRCLFAGLVVHGGVFVALDHGDRSHRNAVEIVAVWSLLLWLPLLDRHLRDLDWPAGSAPWIRAFRGWWALLLVSAAVTFLPGVLDRLKFTNALVAHAHLAMAGTATSFLVLVLRAVLRDTALRSVFDGRGAFVLWHGGNLSMVACLAALGLLESFSPGRLFRPDTLSAALYAARAGAGAAMSLASLVWLRAALLAARRASAPRGARARAPLAIEARPALAESE